MPLDSLENASIDPSCDQDGSPYQASGEPSKVTCVWPLPSGCISQRLPSIPVYAIQLLPGASDNPSPIAGCSAASAGILTNNHCSLSEPTFDAGSVKRFGLPFTTAYPSGIVVSSSVTVTSTSTGNW